LGLRHGGFLFVDGLAVADSTARATATTFDQRQMIDDDVPLTALPSPVCS
jgi:hypothetical protein